jgi:terminase, large subunit
LTAPTPDEQRSLPIDSYAAGGPRFRDALITARGEAIKPPPRLSLSQWAARFAYLSPETSAAPGRFEAFAYQNGILDAVTDPAVRQVTVMKSARVGYTECLDHIVGYFIHQDPAPVLVVQPRVEDAEDYSRTEIAPMLRDTPALAAISGDLKAKDSNQRILKRVFRNGASVSFVGANSPGGFRRITARIVCFDEVDGYPSEGAGVEGDQITLGTKRSESFWNRKIVIGSTPTVKGASRIEKAWAESDQRRYHVPCPHCGHVQVLKWERLQWDKTAEGVHLPDTAHFVCEGAGCVIEERDKSWMINQGEWIADKPSVGHAGFHIWAAYSLFPNAAWRHLVAEFLRVRRDPVLLRTFVNLVLGETWEEAAETVEGSSLLARGESYGPGSIPDAVLLLGAGVDTQGDRLEVQIIGWGLREEAWAVDYHVLHGDPAQQQVWNELDELLLAKYLTDTGRELRIRAACLDTGGNHANQVLAFCRTRRSRRVFPIKGAAGPRPIWPKRASRTKTTDTLFILGVDTAKDAIYGRLRIQKQGPGYIHFPAGEDFGAEYFEQLTSERVVTRYRQGRPYRFWELPPGKRNEGLDTFVYALAARMSLTVRLDRDAPPPMLVAPPRPAQRSSPTPSSSVQERPVGPTITVAPHKPSGRRSIASMLAK